MPVGIGLGAVGLYGANRASKSAKDAAEASTAAAGTMADTSLQSAEIAAQSQREALDYLKQVNALPMEYRDQALAGLASHYQTPGAPKTQQQLIDEARNSPLYAAIQGTTEPAVDQMARYASATGGLRSGNAQVAFGREAQRINQDALLQSYNQAQGDDRYERALNLSGLSGLAGLNTGANEIANLTASIGQTQAQGLYGAGQATSQGQIAAAQARQQGTQNAFGNLMGIGGLAAQLYGSGMINI